MSISSVVSPQAGDQANDFWAILKDWSTSLCRRIARTCEFPLQVSSRRVLCGMRLEPGFVSGGSAVIVTFTLFMRVAMETFALEFTKERKDPVKGTEPPKAALAK